MHHKRIGLAVVTSTLVGACSGSTHAVTASGEVSSPATPATARTLPEGTLMELSLDQPLAAATTHTGDNFSTTVANPVIALNGHPTVPAGAHVWGHVSAATSPGGATQLAVLVLDFDSMTYARHRYPFEANVTAARVQKAVASTYESTRSGGANSVLSSTEKANVLRAAGLGSVSGTAISLGRSGESGVLPAGAHLSVQTTQSVTLWR